MFFRKTSKEVPLQLVKPGATDLSSKQSLTLIKHLEQMKEEKGAYGRGNRSNFIAEVQRKTQLLWEEGWRAGE